MIRVVLPHHLRTLARVGAEVQLEIDGAASPSAILDALESRYPMLKGTIRDYETQKRRPLLRFYACGEDLSFAPPDAPLPDAIAKGEEPFLIWGAVAGG
jgi:sulfur-carrier protein